MFKLLDYDPLQLSSHLGYLVGLYQGNEISAVC